MPFCFHYIAISICFNNDIGNRTATKQAKLHYLRLKGEYMKAKTQKQQSNFKKTVLSIVVISTVVGGLMLLDDYKSEQSALQFSEQLMRYQVMPEESEGESFIAEMSPQNEEQINFDASLLTTDVTELANIAEENLIVSNSEPSLIKKQAPLASLQSQEKSAITPQENSLEATLPSAVVLFDLSSSVITPEYQLTLVSLAGEIKAQSGDKLWQVVGYTDKSGNAQYNLALAEKRSQNVAAYLAQQGVSKQQLSVLTFGEYEAVKLENSTYNQQLRKVEIQEYKPQVTALAIQVQQFYSKQKIADEKAAKINTEQVRAELQDSEVAIVISKEVKDKNTETLVITAPTNAIVITEPISELKSSQINSLSKTTVAL